MKRLLTLIILALLSHTAHAAGKTAGCIDWPRLMAQNVIDLRTEGPVIVVKPFKNFTGKESDDWLTVGYRDFIADLLWTAESARTWTSSVAAYAPSSAKKRYIVGGTFQHLPGTLRAFIEVKDAVDNKVVRVIKMETVYPNTAEFFYRTGQAVKEIGDAIGITFRERDFAHVRDATHSTQAFEYYSKGRQEFERYDPAKWEIARIWFDQARKADFHSWLSYEGIIDLYTFQALRAKLLGQSYTLYYQLAEDELRRMQKLAKRPPAVPRWGRPKKRKKRQDELRLTNRFLKGNAQYQRGVTALDAGDAKTAVEYLRRATQEVPEDAVAWSKLAQALSRMGAAPEAAAARSKAHGINRCR